MTITHIFKCALCIGPFLWMHIVPGAGLTPQLAGKDWLRESISEADAKSFCADILALCDGPSKNMTSRESSPLPCGVAECCRSRTLLQFLQSARFSNVKIRSLKNICFTKWAYMDMLENSHKIRHEALRKIKKLMLLETNSSQLNMREKSQLAHDLQNIASSFVSSETTASVAPDKMHPAIEENPLPLLAVAKRSVRLTYRSIGVPRCQMRMATVLVRYSLTCLPKSVLIWYCQGTCESRSVPQFHEITNNVRSVEDCTCCSARVMKYRTITFRCTGGDINRRVTWPFDCACRPCSNAPSMEEMPSP